MHTYRLKDKEVDSVELKCLVVGKGLKVSKEVYRNFAGKYRLSMNPLTCNCFFLSDGTIVQLTDMGFHLQYLSGILSWDNLKLLRYASALETPFSLRMHGQEPALYYHDELVDVVRFPPATDFYKQKTASGLPFIGNAVLQGVDWVAFQCLWPCEYAAAGKPCEFCFSGGDFQTLARKKKPLPAPVPPADMAEIVRYAMEQAGCNSVQITGGSTFDCGKESGYILAYLEALAEQRSRGAIPGEILLYITPPKDTGVLDAYFSQGASRVACSLEVWDEKLAATITPGKIAFTTRQRHLDALEYVAKTYGPGKAFSNFIIGIEPFESLKEGATYLAQRGVLPTASIWMPMGRPVNGSMRTPDVEYYRRVKELFADLYQRYGLEPADCCGLNVCMERDIWRYACGAEPCSCAAAK